MTALPPLVTLLLLRLCLFVLLLASVPTVQTLQLQPPPSPAPKQKQKPVQRVCIVGAGIAGLTLAHGLTNSPSLMMTRQEGGTTATTTTTTAAVTKVSVSVFDSRPSLDYTAGSGVQLNGGLACLGRLNPDVQRAVIDAALPVDCIRGRHKAWNQKQKGNGDGAGGSGSVSRLWDYSIQAVVTGAGEIGRDLLDANGNVLWYAIMRGALQEVLLDLLPKKQSQVAVQFGKTLTNIVAKDDDDDGSGSSGAYCHFSDGTTAGPYDLIVGCDGIKSAVKEYVEGGTIPDGASSSSSSRSGSRGDAASASASASSSSSALYSGIRISYAVRDQDENTIKKKNNTDGGKQSSSSASSLKQTFADGAYALSGTYGNGKDRPPCDCFFVTSLDDGYNGPFKIIRARSSDADNDNDDVVGGGRPSDDDDASNSIANANAASENADWTQNVLQPKDSARQEMQKRIDRYGVYDDDARRTVANADRFFELGVYFHSPFSWAGWSKEIPSSNGSFAVLCGDAAHAMPPFLGQGANQAIQDAYSLAQRIHSFNARLEKIPPTSEDSILVGYDEKQPEESLKSILKQYERVRWTPTASITTKAVILGYLETGGKDGFYAKFRDVFFKVLAFFGVPTMVLLDSATPKV